MFILVNEQTLENGNIPKPDENKHLKIQAVEILLIYLKSDFKSVF